MFCLFSLSHSPPWHFNNNLMLVFSWRRLSYNMSEEECPFLQSKVNPLLWLQMMKAMNKSNEHVLAGGACFNDKADSHLVCVQNDDGNYQTQAISIHNQPRKGERLSWMELNGRLYGTWRIGCISFISSLSRQLITNKLINLFRLLCRIVLTPEDVNRAALVLGEAP